MAVEHELQNSETRQTPRTERMREIAHRIASSLIRDARPPDELLGYDEYGLLR
jgi:hypothetical protein